MGAPRTLRKSKTKRETPEGRPHCDAWTPIPRLPQPGPSTGRPSGTKDVFSDGATPLCQGPSVTRLSVLPTVRALNVQPTWSLEFLGNPLRVQVFCSLQREATCVQAPCRNMLKAESQGGENKSHPQPPRQSYWLAFPRQLQRHGMRFFSTKKQHTYFC